MEGPGPESTHRPWHAQANKQEARVAAWHSRHLQLHLRSILKDQPTGKGSHALLNDASIVNNLKSDEICNFDNHLLRLRLGGVAFRSACQRMGNTTCPPREPKRKQSTPGLKLHLGRVRDMAEFGSVTPDPKSLVLLPSSTLSIPVHDLLHKVRIDPDRWYRFCLSHSET